MRTSRNKNILLNVASLMLASVLLFAVVSADAAPATQAKAPATADQKKKKKTAKKNAALKPVAQIAPKTQTAVKAAPAKNLTTKTLTQAQMDSAKKIAPTMKKPVAAAPAIEDSNGPSQSDFAPSQLQAAVKAPEAPKKRWAVLAAFQRSHNVYEEEMGQRKELDDFLSDITYKIGDNFTALAEITWERDTQSGEADFGDTVLQLSRKGYGITKSLTLGPKTYYIVPNSKGSQKQESHGAFGGGLTLGFAEGALPTGLAIVSDVTLTAFNQEYQTTPDGKFLTQYSSRQRVIMGYDIWKLSLSAVLYHKSAQDYSGVINEAYGHAEEVAYNVNDNFAVALGHSLDGSMMKPNTVDTNIYFVNKADSMFYGSMTVKF